MSAMTGAAPVPVPPPIAGGDEDHVGALQDGANLLLVLQGRLLPDLRFAPGAETSGDLGSQRNTKFRLRALQRLQVRIDGDELHIGEPRLNHTVDRVAAAAADTDDLNDRRTGARRRDRKIVFVNLEIHALPPLCILLFRRTKPVSAGPVSGSRLKKVLHPAA